MYILIVEDEPPIARHIEWTCKRLLKDIKLKIETVHTLDEAAEFLETQPVDLCLLDLNLKGKNGYDLLKTAVSGNFHTVIISAYTDQAIEAFNYGVLDFVPKPITDERMQAALDRFLGRQQEEQPKAKYIAVRKQNMQEIIALDNVLYFKAEGYYVEIHLKNGSVEILDKHLNRLEQILPERFLRTHRSYIIDSAHITSYKHHSGGTYQVVLDDSIPLPLSRQKYKWLKEHLHI